MSFKSIALVISAIFLLALVTGTYCATDDISINSNSNNNLSKYQYNGHANVIENSTGKSRFDAEKRQVQEFLNAKTIFKSITKLFMGNQDEVNATSRNILGIVANLLSIVKNHLTGQKGRSSSPRTIKDTAEDVASASVSMLQGYIKSVLTNEDKCVLRYLCEASKEAVRDGRELGYVVASVGGYASSHILGNSKSSFNHLYDAAKKGRNVNDESSCSQYITECADSKP